MAEPTKARLPSQVFSPAQLATLHDVILVTSSLSILGCLYILGHHYRLRRRSSPSIMQTMVAILSLVDMSYAIPKAIGLAGANGSFKCDLQGFMISFTGIMCTRDLDLLTHLVTYSY
jgi:hypothetical protein